MKDQLSSTERRDFLKKAATAAIVTCFPAIISAQTVTNAIKVGLVGCADQIRKTLGWNPAGTFRELAREMVDTELAAIDSPNKTAQARFDS